MISASWGRCTTFTAFCTALSLGAAAEGVQISAPPRFDVAEEDEFTIIDVVYNGRTVAGTPARFNAETITFDDPEGLANLLPGLRDTERVAWALKGPQPTNQNYACTAPSPPNPCDYIYPDDVSLIFDPVKLQVELFINDLYTYNRDPRARYLPPPTTAPGLITSFDTRTAYSFDTHDFIGTQNFSAIAGHGRNAVRTELFTNSNSQSRLQALSLTHTGETSVWSAGIQTAQFGGNLYRSRQLLGLRWGSTLETRMDKNRLGASPLEISVAQSATIEIQRDGDTIDVQQIEPGQTQLDTSRMPSGSYNIDLIIDEGGRVRRETRYFSTSSRLPPSEAPQWYVELGQAIPFGARDNFIATGETPVISIGRHQRIGANMSLKLDATATDDVRFAELSTTAQSNLLSGTLSLLAADDGTYGYSLNGNARLGDWSFNGTYRKLELGTEPPPRESEAYSPFANNFEQASLSANRSGRRWRFGMRGFYRKGSTGQDSWFAGPSLDYTLLNQRQWRLNMQLRQEWGSDRETSYFGVRLAKTFNRPNKIAPRIYLNARYDTTMTENTATGEMDDITVADADIRAELTRSSVTRASVFGGVRFDDKLGTRAGLDYSSPWLEARLNGRHNYQNQNTALFDIRSGLVFGGHGVSWASTRREAGVQMHVDGPPGNPVAVQVDRQTRTVAQSGGHAFLPLDGFSIYDVGIQPERTRNIEYDPYTDRLVAYPGNVVQLAREVRPITIIYAQLVDEAGAPLQEAFLEYEDKTIGTTDEGGYFQIDASPGDQIRVRITVDQSCEVVIPENSDPSDAYFDAGTLTCS
ncbi:MAG: TcfC E-set like domain-containing protein [Henriciella sp.]